MFMPITKAKVAPPTIAYFSMEIALDPNIPTYSGGLGILAGDTLRSFADIGVPVVAVTLVYRNGYFRQQLDASGSQTEQPQPWDPERTVEAVDAHVSVEIEGRTVAVRAWKYTVTGVTGSVVPVYLLDTDLPENTAEDRRLTDRLYGGAERYRLCQEMVLGLGGLQMLQKVVPGGVQRYHMNEGHSSLLALGLLERRLSQSFAGRIKQLDIDSVRQLCIFTTHTPVPAGHDKFPPELVKQVLGDERTALLHEAGIVNGGALNMTNLALQFSGYVNGVAMRHGEVSREMFPSYQINAITNGVHAVTWTAPPLQKLFDRLLPGWRVDNNYLRYAISIPLEDVRSAHLEAKQALFAEIKAHRGVELDPKAFTIGFARRASTYKRADFLFSDAERLRKIAREVGPIQLVYGGKAHPRDEGGKQLIRQVYSGAASVSDAIKTVYVENYDMRWGGLMTSGVDIWLNNPRRPEEASGTSGMKAAMNGVPSLSVVDGWWIEGYIEGITGWSVGSSAHAEDPAAEIASLYNKLEREIVPMYYKTPDQFTNVQRLAIALNGSFFNTQRMVHQYVTNAYSPRKEKAPAKAGETLVPQE
jgi:starch phosphorylase